MIPEQRRQILIQTVLDQGGATIKDLSKRHEVSEMTIRRDLRQLAKEGQIRISHGGAVPISAKQGSEQLYSFKETVNREAKSAIAKYAVEHFVNDNDVIILDPGTTAVHMIPHLKAKTGLTIVTNGLQTITMLRELLPQAKLICTGGILRGVSHTFVGPPAEGYFREFFATHYFISSVGVTLSEGLTDPQILDTQVKKAMLRSADKTIALLDSSKFGIRSTVKVSDISELHAVVTDDEHEAEAISSYEELIDLRLVN